jgi:hypothetical protein
MVQNFKVLNNMNYEPKLLPRAGERNQKAVKFIFREVK